MAYNKDLTKELVSVTFPRLLQISGSDNTILDGTGSIVNFAFSGSTFIGDMTGSLLGTASYADTASYAFYAVSASYEIIKEISSSHADTASFAHQAMVTSLALLRGHLMAMEVI